MRTALKLHLSPADNAIPPKTKLGEAPLILLVDDEPELLSSIRDLLSPNYNVLTAESGPRGLELIKKHGDQIRLIITDQRMPGMTGVQLLSASLKLLPDALRIVLTGYTDLNDLIEMINHCQIHQFITKPTDPQNFQLTVQRAMETAQLKLENQRLIKELQDANRQLQERVAAQEAAKGRRLHLSVLHSALALWQIATGKSKADLADESGLWNTYFDPQGSLRSKTMDRYLNLGTLPQKPKSHLVLGTAKFVLEKCPGPDSFRHQVEEQAEELQGYLLQDPPH